MCASVWVGLEWCVRQCGWDWSGVSFSVGGTGVVCASVWVGWSGVCVSVGGAGGVCGSVWVELEGCVCQCGWGWSVCFSVGGAGVCASLLLLLQAMRCSSPSWWLEWVLSSG